MRTKSTQYAICRTPFIAIGAWLLIALPAPAQELLWITQIGTRNEEHVWGLAADDAGGTFVVGSTDGSLGVMRWGRMDAFVGRFDSAGKQLWMRQFGTLEFDSANGAAPDGEGGVFVTGAAGGDLGGPSNGFGDAFVARYSANGRQVWIRQFGTTQSDTSVAAADDGVGGVVVAGITEGSLGGLHIGGRDTFVARFDGAGNQLWTGQLGSSRNETTHAVASDGMGGAFVAGETQGALAGPSAGEDDAFLARFDNAGNVLWIRQFGTSEFDDAMGLAADGMGGVIVTGSIGSALNGTNSDVFTARYDAQGNETWFRRFGTTASDKGLALTPDGRGGAIVAGHTGGSLGAPHLGFADIFLARYDSAGNQLWVTQFGTSFVESPHAVVRDAAGGIVVGGFTMTNLGGPYQGGFTDAFIARMNDSCYPDCDGSGVLDIFDFLCFQNSFVAGEPYACECDPDPACDIFDFLCFQTAFVAGCP